MPPGIADDIGDVPDARERLVALLRRELQRVAAEPQHVRLLLEYWARGAHNTTIRRKILAGLDGYREVFRALADEALSPHAGRLGRTTPAGLPAVAVGLILGYPVQAMIAPNELDPEEYLASAAGMLRAN